MCAEIFLMYRYLLEIIGESFSMCFLIIKHFLFKYCFYKKRIIILKALYKGPLNELLTTCEQCSLLFILLASKPKPMDRAMLCQKTLSGLKISRELETSYIFQSAC